MDDGGRLDQGVIVMYASNVEGGWSYGARSVNAAGPLVEELAGRDRARP